MKTSCVNMFETNLENYEKKCDSISKCNFWDVSRIVLDKIVSLSYLDSKEKHNLLIAHMLLKSVTQIDMGFRLSLMLSLYNAA